MLSLANFYIKKSVTAVHGALMLQHAKKMLEQDWDYPEKMCYSSCFFCNSSYTVIVHQLISPSTHEEKPKEETCFLKWWETEMMSSQWARKIAPVTKQAANLLDQHRCASGRIVDSFPAHVFGGPLKKSKVWALHLGSAQPAARMSLGQLCRVAPCQNQQPREPARDTCLFYLPSSSFQDKNSMICTCSLPTYSACQPTYIACQGVFRF